MDQLGGSVRWLNDHNPEVDALPVMLHPSRVCDAKATVVADMRVVTQALFGKLKEAVTSYAAARQQPGPLDDRTGRPRTARTPQAHRRPVLHHLLRARALLLTSAGVADLW
ncbi:hypothetical protein [Streptomyces sp. NBRC 109706]|uniref:hypothetical protein n=1 Tax=Streptomyces sp. NBRC 109706 TaxID=1550035 RepID=UPI000785DFE7|nr:hypothetical protein [Streptomyces sp. NBRC 109706]